HLVTLDLVQAASVLPAALQAQLMPLARYAAANLPPDDPVVALADWETPLDPVAEDLTRWRAVADLLLTNDDSFRKEKGINVKDGFPPTTEGKEKKQAFVDLMAVISLHPDAARDLARVRHLPKLSHLEDTWHLVAALARLLNLAAAHLWTVFQEANEVDFIGIAQRALAALQDDTGATDLALKLDYRISHLLVDEFQDTSPTQVELLRRLTRGWIAGDGRTLFCVGDPMQSVYRFRKAEVGLFLQIAEQGLEELKLTRLKLHRNNRSDPALVDWINQAFKRAFPEEDNIAHGAIGYRPFEATRESVGGAGVEIHPVIVPQGTNRAVAEVAEACCIADIIEAEQAEDPERTIAVLVRARAHLDALVTEIRRKRPWIKFQAVEIEELQGRQSVQDVLALTHALHHRADRVHWLAILRAPWCGLTLADLHVLAADDHDATIWALMQDEARLQKMSTDGQERLHQLREVLAQALAQQGRQTVRRWVEGVWLLLNGPACLWEAGDVRDVQAFFDLIEELEASGEFALPSLEARMQKLYAAPDAEAPDCLQFMTIHKSKGLEFDTVILPGLDRSSQSNQQDKPLLLWEEVALPDDAGGAVTQPGTQLLAAPLMPKISRADNLPTPYDYIKALEEERAAHENLRVLYVAATRAERKLHLVATARKHAKNGISKPATSTHLGQLWESVGDHFMAAAECFNEETIPAQKADTSMFTPQLLRLEQTGAPLLLQSLITSSGASGALPASDVSTDSMPQDGESGTIETHIGILAHRYVELIAQQGLQFWSTK
ncbi:MAG TPA: 3'-5' exonuclease, partial [Methylophilaceae bacterium]|nr:3'-5' exonuclease [Methylophilaceae bacterium]